MGYENVVSLECDEIIALGGVSKKTGKANPKSIEGFYLGSTTRETKSGEKPSTVYVFSTEKGNIGVWGKTHLDRIMPGAKVGLMTLLTQEGTRPTKHMDMYLFNVKQDKTRSIDVGTVTSFDERSTDSAEESFGYDEGLPEPEEVVETYVAPKPPVKAAVTPSAESQAKIRAALAARSATARR